jgi:hypothetical protein
MTLQLLHSEFPFILGKFYFLFYQCGGWGGGGVYVRSERWRDVKNGGESGGGGGIAAKFKS